MSSHAAEKQVSLKNRRDFSVSISLEIEIAPARSPPTGLVGGGAAGVLQEEIRPGAIRLGRRRGAAFGLIGCLGSRSRCRPQWAVVHNPRPSLGFRGECQQITATRFWLFMGDFGNDGMRRRGAMRISLYHRYVISCSHGKSNFTYRPYTLREKIVV